MDLFGCQASEYCVTQQALLYFSIAILIFTSLITALVYKRFGKKRPWLLYVSEGTAATLIIGVLSYYLADLRGFGWIDPFMYGGQVTTPQGTIEWDAFGLTPNFPKLLLSVGTWSVIFAVGTRLLRKSRQRRLDDGKTLLV